MDTQVVKYSQKKKDKKSDWSKLSAAEIALLSGYEEEDENFQTETDIQRADASKGTSANARFWLAKAFHIGHKEIGFSINGTRFTGHTGWQVRGGTVPIGKGLAIDMAPTELEGDELGVSAHLRPNSPEPQLVYFGRNKELQEIKLSVIRGEVGALANDRLRLYSTRPVRINLAEDYWANTSKLHITQEGLKLEDVDLVIPEKGNGSNVYVEEIMLGEDGIKVSEDAPEQVKQEVSYGASSDTVPEAAVEVSDEYLYGTADKEFDTTEIQDGVGIVSKTKSTTLVENKKSSEPGGPNDPALLALVQKKHLGYDEYSQFEGGEFDPGFMEKNYQKYVADYQAKRAALIKEYKKTHPEYTDGTSFAELEALDKEYQRVTGSYASAAAEAKKKVDASAYKAGKITDIAVTGDITETNEATKEKFAGLPAELIKCMKDGVVPKEKNREQLTAAAGGKVEEGAPQLTVEERLRKYQELFYQYGVNQRLYNDGKKRDASATDIDTGDEEKEKLLFPEIEKTTAQKVKEFFSDAADFKHAKALGVMGVEKGGGWLVGLVCDKVNKAAKDYRAADAASAIGTTAAKDAYGRAMAALFEGKGFLDSYKESIHKGLVDDENEQIDKYNAKLVKYNIPALGFDIPIIPPWMSASFSIGADFYVGTKLDLGVALPASFGANVTAIAMDALGKVLEKPASADPAADAASDSGSELIAFVESKLKALGLNVHASAALCGKFGVNAGIGIVLGMKTFFAVTGGASAGLAVHGSGPSDAFASFGIDKEFKFADIASLNLKKIISSGRTDLNIQAGLAVDGGVEAAFKLVSRIIGLDYSLWSKNFISFSPFNLKFATTLRSDDGDFLNFKTLKGEFSTKFFGGLKDNKKGPYGLTFNTEDAELTGALAKAKSGLEEFDKQLAEKYGEVKLDDLNEAKLKEITDMLIEHSVLFRLQADEIREMIDRKEREENYRTGIVELEEKVNKYTSRIRGLGKDTGEDVNIFVGKGVERRARRAAEERAVEALATREALLRYEKERVRMISDKKSPTQKMIEDYIEANPGKENVPNPEFTEAYLRAADNVKIDAFGKHIGARLGSANILNSSSLFVDKEDLIALERKYLEMAVKKYSDDLGLLLTLAQENGLSMDKLNEPNKTVTDAFFEKAQTRRELRRNPVEQRVDIDDLIAYEESQVKEWTGKLELIEAFKALSELMDKFTQAKSDEERAQIDALAQDYIDVHSAELGFDSNDILLGRKPGSEEETKLENLDAIPESQTEKSEAEKPKLTGYSDEFLKAKGQIDLFNRISAKKYGAFGKISKKKEDPIKELIRKSLPLDTIIDFEIREFVYYGSSNTYNLAKYTKARERAKYMKALFKMIKKLKDEGKREQLIALVKEKYFSGELDKEIFAGKDELLYAMGEKGNITPNKALVERVYKEYIYSPELHRALLKEDGVEGDIDESKPVQTEKPKEPSEEEKAERARLAKLSDNWISTEQIYNYVEQEYLSAPMQNKLRSGLNWVGNKLKWVGYKLNDLVSDLLTGKADDVGGAVSGAMGPAAGKFGKEVGSDVSGVVSKFAPEKKNRDIDRLLREGHMGRLKKLLEVKRILPTLKDDDERHKMVVATYKNGLRAGWGFSVDKFFSRKGIEDTPEKIRAFLVRRINEEGADGEKKIAMLKAAKTPEDIAAYRDSLRGMPASGFKRIGRKIVNVTRWAFRDSATYADIDMKQKAKEKLTPAQILNYEIGIAVSATKKHNKRILMLEKSVGRPDKEVYKRYLEMGGGEGFKRAFAKTIERNAEAVYAEVYGKGHFTKGQVLSYEKSRLEYYRKQLEERKKPVTELREKLRQIREKMELIKKLEDRRAG